MSLSTLGGHAALDPSAGSGAITEPRMRVLEVIHGYPPHYMAGSEVYTRNLVRELASHASVSVFTRVENPFKPAYQRSDSVEDGVLVRRINKPSRDYTFQDKYTDPNVDDAFRLMMRDVRPDIVHVGHLSHLSTGIVGVARREFQVPVVLTLHDYWMSCFRGQLVDPGLKPCDGPSDEKCHKCAAHSYKDLAPPQAIEVYRKHMAGVLTDVDAFLAPSHTIERFFLDQGIPASKLLYSPYGFPQGIDTTERRLAEHGEVRFGFLGRVIPVKGVALLLNAFRRTRGPARLRIHGSTNGHAAFLQELAGGDARIEICGPYENDRVADVLAGLDAVVVPSLWRENAPLVIQEAQLARLPVITSNVGGMAEFVRDGIDGYHFPLGDESALAAVLQGIIDDPGKLERLAVDPSRIRDISDDAQACLRLYRKLCSPERITLVTNPGVCNLACPMCDTHSGFAPAEHGHHLPILAWETVESTVRDLARLGLREVIPSTMGEPLMYPSFDRLLALLRELGLTLNLTTNGSFPRGGVARWAPALLPVLSDMKISLNGVAADVNEAIMSGVDTEQQLASLQAFMAARDRFVLGGGRRSSLTIQATFMERNLAHLPELLRWAIAHGVDRFKGHHLWVTWPQLEGESLRRSPDAARRWNRIARELMAIAATERGPDGRHIRLEHVSELDESTPAGPPTDTECPFLGREAWLEADGSFQVCCCPSDKRRAFGDFGNVSAAPFARLWASSSYREFVQGWGEHPNCKTCNMRRPRRGVLHA